MRKRLFEIIEVAQDKDRISTIYDITMMCAIVISIIPLHSRKPIWCFLALIQ